VHDEGESMSIIEKALSKLGPKPQADEAPPQAIAEEAGLVEQSAQRTGQPAPEAAASTPPVQPRQAQRDTQPASRQVNLNFDKLRARGLLTSDDERSQMAEEYRMIKRPILANAFGANPVKNGNMVMVTSALPGEGKSFSTINLAISIAMELDRTVLLVDADVAKPRIPEYLGFHADHGLLDVLQHGTQDLSSVILRTNIDSLSILPAGRTYTRATELLASEAMHRLIRDLATRYPDRLVLFDSPPLLSTSESNVLASHMGQIVMVVEADKSRKPALREALSRIEDKCDVVGLILNKGVPHSAGGYYGYYGYANAAP
jgi:protein-tyrosine kinase